MVDYKFALTVEDSFGMASAVLGKIVRALYDVGYECLNIKEIAAGENDESAAVIAELLETIKELRAERDVWKAGQKLPNTLSGEPFNAPPAPTKIPKLSGRSRCRYGISGIS